MVSNVTEAVLEDVRVNGLFIGDRWLISEDKTSEALTITDIMGEIISGQGRYTLRTGVNVEL